MPRSLAANEAAKMVRLPESAEFPGTGQSGRLGAGNRYAEA
jgi:hypothetical protein